MKMRVYYEDTDAGGVVYHSKYLNFCERARSELFFEHFPCIFEASKGHFLVSQAECAFIKSAKLGDLLEIKTQIIQVKRASVLLMQEIFRCDGANLSQKLFQARFTLAFVKDEKPCAMSDELKAVFERLF